MKESDMAILIEGLRRLSADVTQIADALEEKTTPAIEQQETKPDPMPDETPTEPEKEVTKEELRAVLAEKTRSGFRAEVKALLTAHGVENLSGITDPAERALVMKEAEGIGNG